MEGYSCIKNRGVHEDRKHDKDCEGGEKWYLPGICPFCEIMGAPAFATILYEILYEIATIPTMSA